MTIFLGNLNMEVLLWTQITGALIFNSFLFYLSDFVFRLKGRCDS